MSKLSNFLFGSKDKLTKVPTGTPQQEQLLNMILANAMGMGNGGNYQKAQNYFGNILDPGSDAFEKFSAPYMNEFNEQILPQIAERFAGMGALSSSGFGQSLGGAASGLQSNLARLFSDLQSDAASKQYGQFSDLSRVGLGYEPFAYKQTPGSTGLLGSLASGMGSVLAGPLGFGLTGGISNLFKRSSGGMF